MAYKTILPTTRLLLFTSIATLQHKTGNAACTLIAHKIQKKHIKPSRAAQRVYRLLKDRRLCSMNWLCTLQELPPLPAQVEQRVLRECKGKAKACNIRIAPRATYRSCSGAVHVTDSGRTAYWPPVSLRPQTNLRPTNHTPALSAI